MTAIPWQPTPEAALMFEEIQKGKRWIRTNPEALIRALQDGDASVLLTALTEDGGVDPAFVGVVLDQQLKYLINQDK